MDTGSSATSSTVSAVAHLSAPLPLKLRRHFRPKRIGDNSAKAPVSNSERTTIEGTSIGFQAISLCEIGLLTGLPHWEAGLLCIQLSPDLLEMNPHIGAGSESAEGLFFRL